MLFECGEVVMWMGFFGLFGGLCNCVKFNFGMIYLFYWELVIKNLIYIFIGGVVLFVL